MVEIVHIRAALRGPGHDAISKLATYAVAKGSKNSLRSIAIHQELKDARGGESIRRSHGTVITR